jgi:hippurate hydrolase
MTTDTADVPPIGPQLQADLHTLYKQLHAAPELSMQEQATAALITQRMGALGYDTFGCGGTGVVATLENGAGPVVGFRADIDARTPGWTTPRAHGAPCRTARTCR